jgi:ectoine hydroxylase-related dioxygenase (phytanoyl-CoA dioxygenase family)
MLRAMARPFEAMLGTIWAYTDFTVDNGATIVVPGSHKWERTRRPKEAEITYAEMRAGSCLVFLGSLLHAGGSNASEQPRTGILINYCLGWLRQFENFYLECPPEVARDYPEQLRKLLGYAVHPPNLGLYEGNNPEVLFSDRSAEIDSTKDNILPEHEAFIAAHVTF